MLQIAEKEPCTREDDGECKGNRPPQGNTPSVRSLLKGSRGRQRETGPLWFKELEPGHAGKGCRPTHSSCRKGFPQPERPGRSWLLSAVAAGKRGVQLSRTGRPSPCPGDILPVLPRLWGRM